MSDEIPLPCKLKKSECLFLLPLLYLCEKKRMKKLLQISIMLLLPLLSAAQDNVKVDQKKSMKAEAKAEAAKQKKEVKDHKAEIKKAKKDRQKEDDKYVHNSRPKYKKIGKPVKKDKENEDKPSKKEEKKAL